MGLVRAAGGILWRAGPGEPQVAVIHRPRRDDWSLPKGKLEKGEAWEAAALREVREETGCTARLGPFIGSTWYVPRRTPKVVVFWSMTLLRQGALEAGDEVDELEWLPPREALARLDHASERRVLGRAVAHRAADRAAADDPLAPAVAQARAALLRLGLEDRLDGEALGLALGLLDRADDALAARRTGRARAHLSAALHLQRGG